MTTMTLAERKNLRRIRALRKDRTRDRTPWRKKDLIHALLIENLPYGQFDSATGHSYCFNYEQELLLGWDRSAGRNIPVTRDGWFSPEEWAKGQVSYWYDDPAELLDDTSELVRVAVAYRNILVEANVTTDRLVTWFDALSPRHATKSMRFSVVSTLVQAFLPYGKCETAAGIDVYHNHDYTPLFAWDHNRSTFAALRRDLNLDELDLVGHSYVYGESVPGDGTHEHAGTHPFDDGTFTLRKCMRILDTLGAKSVGV